MPKNELAILGERAKKFILDKKNPLEQCAKIGELINELPV